MFTQRLVASLILAGGALGWAACDSDRRGLESAVLITFDTTRADALGIYRGSAQTVILDRLGERGVVFDRAMSVAPLTLPAHASMLTGLYPPRHGIRDNGFGALPDEARTLSEIAQDAGFQTAAFVGAVVLEETFGLNQGFDVYDAPSSKLGSSTHIDHRPGKEVVQHALEWLQAREPERPFFLWVHLFDPHVPYASTPELLSEHGGDDYLAGIAQTDSFLEPLINELEAIGQPLNLLFVADHGEGLNEHQEDTHGFFVYQTTIAAPMILVRSDGARAGERSSATVSVVDVAPTLSSAMGLSFESGTDGISLWDGDPPEDRGVYFESYAGHLSFGWSPIAGWVDGRGKYIHSPRPELYDLAIDPREETNLMGTARRTENYRRELARIAELPALTIDTERVTPEVVERIQALGYASVGGTTGGLPHPLEEFDGPSPHDSALEMQQTFAAIVMFNNGSTQAALRTFDAVLASNPNNTRSLGMRAYCLLQLDRDAEAIEPLQEYLQRVRGRALDHYNLGFCLETTGRPAEAVRSYRRALEMETTRPVWLSRAMKLLRAQGLRKEANRWKRRFPRKD